MYFLYDLRVLAPMISYIVLFLAVSASAVDVLTEESGEDGHCSSMLLPKRRHRVSIEEFGAVGNGKVLNTQAFRSAILYLSSLASDGGAQLYVPPGKWLTGSFNLTSNFTLFIDQGATIVGSQNIVDWPVIPPLPSYGTGRELPGGRHSSLIHGEDLTDVVITGANGTIDGQGSVWWDWFRNKTLDFTRGHLVELINSRQVIISSLTFKDSPFWTLHPVYCSQVLFRNLTILAPPYAPNVDGIDPDSSTDVCIEHCYISVGDDLISIKSGWDEHGIRYGRPCSNIYIRKVTGQTPTSAGIAFGSEMSGGISNIRIRDTSIANARSGVRIKTGAGRGGYITNVSISGFEMSNVSVAFDFTALYGGHPDDRYDPNAYPVMSRILVENVVGRRVGWAGSIIGLEAAPFTDVCFSNVTLEVIDGSWNCSFASGYSIQVIPLPCQMLAGGHSGSLSACYHRYQSALKK